jgi:nicotinate phosphoribosyltransferase
VDLDITDLSSEGKQGRRQQRLTIIIRRGPMLEGHFAPTFDLAGPIVRSRLEPDFYKFTMGQLIWRKYREVETTFAFQSRTPKARIGEVVDTGELREQFDHARSLMFTNSELHYLRGTNEYQQRMFDEGYLAFLQRLRLPDYHVERRGSDLEILFRGSWAEVTYWETMALSIVNETYCRTLMRRLSKFEREAVFAEGVRRLQEKIALLRSRPDIVFSDFGTRRRFAGAWQHYIDETLMAELNGGSFHGQFLGTSNTYAAMTTGLVPMGTAAHELPMIVAGTLDPGEPDPEWLRRAQRQVIDDWWEQYGWGLSIFLPDTFGMDFFFTVVTADDLHRWKGFRWDSGDLLEFGERVVHAYQQAGIDPHEKMLVASDAVDLPIMLDGQQRLGDRIRMSYGWGTGLTNDLLPNVMIGDRWFGPMSLVIKPTRANGRGLVKLSDNPAKAIGDPADIERYKRAAGYRQRAAVEVRY